MCYCHLVIRSSILRYGSEADIAIGLNLDTPTNAINDPNGFIRLGMIDLYRQREW